MGANAAYSSRRFECIETVDGDDATCDQIGSIGVAMLLIFLTTRQAFEDLEFRLGGDPTIMVPAARRS